MHSSSVIDVAHAFLRVLTITFTMSALSGSTMLLALLFRNRESMCEMCVCDEGASDRWCLAAVPAAFVQRKHGVITAWR